MQRRGFLKLLGSALVGAAAVPLLGSGQPVAPPPAWGMDYSDLWGQGWTTAEINQATFGLVIPASATITGITVELQRSDDGRMVRTVTRYDHDPSMQLAIAQVDHAAL